MKSTRLCRRIGRKVEERINKTPRKYLAYACGIGRTRAYAGGPSLKDAHLRTQSQKHIMYIYVNKYKDASRTRCTKNPAPDGTASGIMPARPAYKGSSYYTGLAGGRSRSRPRSHWKWSFHPRIYGCSATRCFN